MVDISCDVVMRSQNISCGERYIPHGNKYPLWKFDQIILSRKWSTVEMIYSFQKWIILCPNKSFFVEKSHKFPPSMSLQVFYIILWRYRSVSVSWKKIIFHRKEIVENFFLFRVKYSSWIYNVYHYISDFFQANSVKGVKQQYNLLPLAMALQWHYH